MTKHVSWFKDVDVSHTSLCGEQAAKIGDLYKNNFPVPLGFVVNNSAFKEFLERNNLTQGIDQALSSLEKTHESIIKTSDYITNLIIGTDIPASVSERILSAYHNLETGGERFSRITNTALEMISVGRAKKPFVTLETSNNYAGTKYFKKSVQGDEELLENVKKMWASIFSPAGIIKIKRANGNYDTGVIIRKDVEATLSIISFSKNPVNYSDEIFIEASWGSVSPIIEGEFTPDNYIVDKESGNVNSRKKGTQKWMLQRDLRTSQIQRKELSSERANSPILNNDLIKKISYWTKRIETHFGAPQKLIFQMEGNRLFITRVEYMKRDGQNAQMNYENMKELIRGQPASQGSVSGKAKIVQSTNDYNNISKTDIIILRRRLPGIEPVILISGGVILSEGGISSRLLEFTRSVKKPALTGIKDFTAFDENYEITIDSSKGVVYHNDKEVIAAPQTIMMQPIKPLNDKIKVSLEISSHEALQTVMQMCRQYGVELKVINKHEPETPIMEEPEPQAPYSLPEPVQKTPETVPYSFPSSISEPEKEESFSVQNIINEPVDEGPLPLPQTRVETGNYEEPMPPKDTDAYTIADSYKDKKEEKKEEDDLIPYW